MLTVTPLIDCCVKGPAGPEETKPEPKPKPEFETDPRSPSLPTFDSFIVFLEH